MKSVLQLTATARFSGWISSPKEIILREDYSMEIHVFEVSRGKFRACYKNGEFAKRKFRQMQGRHYQPIEGNFKSVEKQLAAVWSKRLTPWVWKRNENKVRPPDYIFYADQT